MFLIDAMSRVPIYEQLTAQIEKYVLIGLLKEGDQLPSVRALSGELSINPNTVQKAYTDLCSRGVLCAVPGKGCFVSADALRVLQEHTRKQLEDFTTLVKVLQLAAVPKEELTAILDAVYETGRDNGCCNSNK